jgi:hypothetical protein
VTGKDRYRPRFPTSSLLRHRQIILPCETILLKRPLALFYKTENKWLNSSYLCSQVNPVTPIMKAGVRNIKE